MNIILNPLLNQNRVLSEQMKHFSNTIFIYLQPFSNLPILGHIV